MSGPMGALPAFHQKIKQQTAEALAAAQESAAQIEAAKKADANFFGKEAPMELLGIIRQYVAAPAPIGGLTPFDQKIRQRVEEAVTVAQERAGKIIVLPGRPSPAPAQPAPAPAPAALPAPAGFFMPPAQFPLSHQQPPLMPHHLRFKQKPVRIQFP